MSLFLKNNGLVLWCITGFKESYNLFMDGIFREKVQRKINENKISKLENAIKSTVLKTNTGELVENTKAIERRILKELCKLTL